MSKKLLKDKKVIHGCFMKIIDNPAMVLLAKNNEIDFLFYDMEHAMFDFKTLHDISLLGKSNEVPLFVRVSDNTKGNISKALDAGVSAVMVPMIESRDDAEQLVKYSKYPPIGSRGYAGGANTFYAPSGNHENNMKQSNEDILTIAQIETLKGLENAEEIINTPGIDAVIVGPADLSISLGIADNKDPSKLKEAIGKIQKICIESNKYFGIIGSIELLEEFNNYLQIMVSAIDLNLINESLKKYKNEYKRIERKQG
ncbi:HpcH/HpaI aldolase family protein [Anaerorhabdus furcosa]|uniref:4-hydroxy-2-oxoheptanedioate aldolase n=1 Tax=Anaerorhabdus furcosa TaxID=118967 RepID=A0A1T4MMG0_9FIRM|nr:aldolase/citrate lyase family protein [Anaerorhabdus furcosa]SJZ67975.1 4-hydroxy-2-oxoheptanedioate aldolase [Anaerorhabdus furcosa]